MWLAYWLDIKVKHKKKIMKCIYMLITIDLKKSKYRIYGFHWKFITINIFGAIIMKTVLYAFLIVLVEEIETKIPRFI